MNKLLLKVRMLLFGNRERAKITKNIFWLFNEKVFRFTLGFFVSILVTRYLGPEQYGILSYAIAFAGLFGVFSTLGLNTILVRELVKQPERRDEIIGTALSMMLISGFIFCLASICSIYFIRPDDHLSLLLVSILSVPFLFKAFKVIALYYESEVNSKRVIPITLGVLVITNLTKICLVYLNFSVAYFAVVSVLESILTSISLVCLYTLTTTNSLKLLFNVGLAKSLFRDGFPLMLSSFMIIVYMRIDQVMIRELTNDKEAGLYAISVRLTELWYFIPVIISSSTFPNIVKSLKHKEEAFNDKLQKLYNLIVLIFYFIAIPISLFATPIITMLYGEPYAESGILLSLLIWAGLFVGLGTIRGAYIFALNLTKIYLYITVSSAILNVVLNLILIPIYGAMGAVLATLASYVLASFLSCFIFKPLWQNGMMMIKALLWPFKL